MNQPHGISETVAENGRRRGRPAKYKPEDYATLPNQRKSLRARQNHLHLLRAGQTLGGLGIDCDQFAITTLAELGRVSDPKAMARLADEIFSRKLTTKQAIDHIRTHRLGAKDPDAMVLGRALAACIRRYRGRASALSDADVQAALRFAGVSWKQ